MTDPVERDADAAKRKAIKRQVYSAMDLSPTSGSFGERLAKREDVATLLTEAIIKIVDGATSDARPTPSRLFTELRNSISTRLNTALVEMKPGYDDSITGFNEAWGIVMTAFGEYAERFAAPPQDEARVAELERHLRAILEMSAACCSDAEVKENIRRREAARAALGEKP